MYIYISGSVISFCVLNPINPHKKNIRLHYNAHFINEKNSYGAWQCWDLNPDLSDTSVSCSIAAGTILSF